MHFGLGSGPGIQRVRIHWLDGRVTEHEDLPLNRWNVVTPEGK